MSDDIVNVAMEFSVLGQILEDERTRETCRSALCASDFSDMRNRYVFNSILELADERKPVDILSVCGRLRRKGVEESTGGEAFLRELISAAYGEASAIGHVAELADLGARRRLKAAARSIERAADDLSQSSEAALSYGAKALAGVTTGSGGAEWNPETALDAFMQSLDEERNGSGRFIKTGIQAWDDNLGGLMPGVMSFIGAQPRVGKSAVLATMLDHTAKTGFKPGYFSLEDSREALFRRWLSRYTGIPTLKISRANVNGYDGEKLKQAYPILQQRIRGIVIDDRSMLTASQVVQRARRMVVNEGVKWIALDHLGKLGLPKDSYRHDLAIEEALNEFTAFVKEYKVPMVILAHTKERDSNSQFSKPDLMSFAQTSFIARDARVAVGLSLVKDDPNVMMVHVLKETEGAGNGEFSLRRIITSGMVESER